MEQWFCAMGTSQTAIQGFLEALMEAQSVCTFGEPEVRILLQTLPAEESPALTALEEQQWCLTQPHVPKEREPGPKNRWEKIEKEYPCNYRQF